MRVRDLEIAMVLAREMKAAASRSVDASLRVEQLQEVFGAEQLDRSERTRIQTALQMAGLEPRPSLLEAELGTPIRFGLGENAPDPAPQEPAGPVADEAQAAEQSEFPTVGEFARSTLRRARRRFSARQAEAGEPSGRDRAITATAEAAGVEEDELEHLATDPDHPAGPAFVEDRVDEIQSPSFGGPSEPPDVPPGGGEDPFDFEEPGVEEEPVAAGEEPVSAEEEAVAAEEEPVVEDDEPVAPESLNGHAAHDFDPSELLEQEEHPEQVPEEEPAYADVEEPVAVEAEPEPAPPPSGARLQDVVAALLPAVAIPVIVTSIAGWRFGLPFVAFSVIAAGLLMRRAAGDAAPGPIAAMRVSAPARAILKATALVAVLSGVAAVLLASLGHDKATVSQKSSSTSKPTPSAAAAKPKQPSKPATAATPQAPRHHRAHHAAPPPSDNSTAGLVRVPPSAKKPATGTGTNGAGSSSGTQGQSGTGTTPHP